MHDFMLEMEEENMNIGDPPFNDWEGLVVDGFEAKPINLGTQLLIQNDNYDHDDHGEFEMNIIDGVSMSGLMMNNIFSDNENIVDSCLDHESKKSSSSPISSSSPDEVVEFKGRSIAERRAAKFGFDASRINVAKFKAVVVSPPASPPIRSPYLTIPPGISPAALLDSPVMLPNSQAQPSPTTGTLQFQQSNHDSFLVLSSTTCPAVDRDKDSAVALFTPPPGGSTTTPILSCTSSAENKIPGSSKSPRESTKADSLKSCATATHTSSTETKIPGKMAEKATTHFNLQKNSTNIMEVQLPQVQGSMPPEEHKGAYVNPAAGADLSRNAEDGYSWRKYGQKHVKGSEYPRSYYKCNNSSCLVKKKVERSHDGEITEIIYKGIHNHPKPHPRISLGPPATSCEMPETSDHHHQQGSEPNGLKAESGLNWMFGNQFRSKDLRVRSDWRPDGLERTSSTSVLTDILDPMAATQGKSASVLGCSDTPELTSRIACLDGEDEDGVTQGSTSQGDEADPDESEPKRRKKEIFSTEAYLPSRSNREPRVIVQIESEIDVLDDGYRWRKYGQKVVKGNPNPRSYYKCTSAGCPVRKHVERASDDIKSVLTTYEGKHNHEVPTTKTTTTGLPSAFTNSPPNISNPNPAAALASVSRNPNGPTREMKVHQDLPLHYEMKPDFLRSNLLGDLVGDLQIGPSSIYQMKFPPAPLTSTIPPYGSFMMSSAGRGDGRASSCQKFPQAMLDFPAMTIPLNVALNNNFHPFNSNHGMQSGSTVVMQSSIGEQQIKEGDLRFLRPKEEKRDDNTTTTISDTCLQATPDNSNVTSSTAFCMVMGNFPS